MATAFLICTPNTGGAISTWTAGGTPTVDGFECVVSIPTELAGATFSAVEFSYDGSGAAGTKNVRYTGGAISVTNANLLEKLQNGEEIRIYFSFRATGGSSAGSASYTWRNVTVLATYTPASAITGDIPITGSTTDVSYSINADSIRGEETATMTLTITPDMSVTGISLSMGDALHTEAAAFTASVSIASGATGTVQLTLSLAGISLTRRSNRAYFKLALSGGNTEESDWTESDFILYRDAQPIERNQAEGRFICVYAPGTTEFDNLGLAVLKPTKCEIKQTAGAEYQLTLVHPITADGAWQYLTDEAIIKAPIPPESIPNLSIDSGEIIVGDVDVYRTTVQTARYSDLGKITTRKVTYQLWHANQMFYPGNKVTFGIQNYECTVQNADATFDPSKWKKIPNTETVTTPPTIADYTAAGTTLYASVDPGYPRYLYGTDENGKTGYWVLANCEYVGPLDPGQADEYLAKTIVEQTFRIDSIQRNSNENSVTVNASQLTYDYSKMVIPIAANVEAKAPQVAAQLIRDRAHPNGLPYPPVIACEDFGEDISVSADWSYQNVAYCVLDPDSGIVPQCHAKLVRDAWRFFILLNDSPDRGFEISYGRNLKGVTWSRSVEKLVTRIFPRAKAANGDPLYYNDGNGHSYVDSPLIGEFAFIRCECIQISAQVGKQNPQGETYTEAMVQAEMLAAAQNKFAIEFCDAVSEDIKVDFIKLGDSEEYKQFRNLERVSIYDTVRIRHPLLSLEASAQVRAYTWDAIRRRFISIELGNIWTYGKQALAGYEIGNGQIRMKKLAPEVIDAISANA